MKQIIILSAILLSACNSTNNVRSVRPVETNLSPVIGISVEIAEKRGKQIFAKDMYSAKATDLLLETGKLNKSRDVKGWVTNIENDIPKTYFIGGQSPDYKVVFEVHFLDGKTPKLVKSSSISKELTNQFKVRQFALDAIQAPCSKKYNTVVLEDGDNYLVYGLASATENDKIVVGGHYRFTYSKNDQKLVSKERLSNSCLELSKENGAIPFATHILTDTPLEIHSYIGKLHGTFYVSTRSGLYKAEDGQLTLIKK